MATYVTTGGRIPGTYTPRTFKTTTLVIGKGLPISLPPRIPSLTGNGRIFGTTKNKFSPANIPVGRRIRVIREFDGVWVKDQWSDAITGAFSIENLNPDYLYTIIVYDHTLQYDPETRGPLSTVPMP